MYAKPLRKGQGQAAPGNLDKGLLKISVRPLFLPPVSHPFWEPAVMLHENRC